MECADEFCELMRCENFWKLEHNVENGQLVYDVELC